MFFRPYWAHHSADLHSLATEKKDESGALHQVYKTERAQLRKIRIASVKKVVERERKLAKLEESYIVGA